VTRTLFLFIGGSLAGIAILAGAFAARDGRNGILSVALAATICLIPTTLSLALALWARQRSGTDQLMAVMGGMMVRMVVVLGASLVTFLNVPQLRETRERELQFWTAIFLCYIGTLAWETFLTARNRRPSLKVDAGLNSPSGGGVT